MRKDGAFIKLERIKQIEKQIAKTFPNPIEIKRLTLWAELNIGLSEERATEYINKLVEGHGWIIDDGKILPEPDPKMTEQK